MAIKRNSGAKTKRTLEILGCTIEFLRAYLEVRFKAGMTWENFGTVWHVDHALPLASAKTTREVYRLCHYTNLQPLFVAENLAKHAKVERQMVLV